MGEMIGKNPEDSKKREYLTDDEQIAAAAGEGMGVNWDIARELWEPQTMEHFVRDATTGEFESKGLLIAFTPRAGVEGDSDHSQAEDLERNDVMPGVSPDSNVTIGSQNRLPLPEVFGNLPDDH